MREFLAALCAVSFIGAAEAASFTERSFSLASGGLPAPIPIGANYIYFSNTAKAISYLRGGIVGTTPANLTGVSGIAADSQPVEIIISGKLEGSKTTQTMTLSITDMYTIPVDEKVSITGIRPLNWNKNCTVISSSEGSFTCSNPNASGAYVKGGLAIWSAATFPTLAHSHGMTAIDFDEGECPSAADTGGCKSHMAYQASVGIDAVIMDEPSGGKTGWPAVIAYWKAQRPGGFFGMTNSDDSEMLAYLQAGVPLDFTQVEEYVNTSASNPFASSGQTTQFPNVKTAILLYGTSALCGNYPQPLASYNTVAFWDVDNFSFLANTGYMDWNWLQNAQIYIETGNLASICNLAISDVSHTTVGTTQRQTGDFQVIVNDGIPNNKSPLKIVSCQYAVYSGANIAYGLDDPSVTQTVPWTTRQCNGPTGVIPLGPGTAGCNLNSVIDTTPSNYGNESFTCAVAYRAIMSNGAYGDETYTTFRIN